MSTPVLNLTFHGIGEPPASVGVAERDVWLSEADFAASLDAIGTLPQATVSFDDGNASDLEIALPALRERGIGATFFVVAGRLGEPDYLSAEDLRALREEGMTIGLHGMHHQRWRGLSDEEIGISWRKLKNHVRGLMANSSRIMRKRIGCRVAADTTSGSA